MPSYAFLGAQDLRDLTALLGSWGPPTLAPLDERPSAGQVRNGREVYRDACAFCHGDDGMGGWAPMINSPPFLHLASNGFLRHAVLDHGRIARSGPRDRLPRTLLPEEVEHVLAYVRNWSGEEPFRLRPREDEASSVARGEKLFAARCTECHGARGEGKTAAGLTQPEFQLNVTDAHLTMTILVGRPGTPMQAWMSARDNPLTAEDALDLVAHLRSLGRSRIASEARVEAPSANRAAPGGSGG
jgi:cytochrome c oxidase cbb3-type subunit 3